uniref:RRM domain-containing protein n=1 Tax=Schizophyllum commune (strain H4-8 / FGSC 9210) TaxID=578458 RepID=D8PLH9_SCHCM
MSPQYADPAAAAVPDPYSDYSAPPAAPPRDDRDRDRDAPPSRRSRSRSPARSYARSVRSPVPPKRPSHAPIAPNPTQVLGVFGLSIRTEERDLDEEFSRFGTVEKVTIVYDQRSGRSRGFGFIRMSTVEEATRCIQELNGIDLNGRNIRVDYSVTDRPHAPTPGEYMGHRRAPRDSYRDSSYHRDRDRDYYRDRDSYRDYDRDYRRDDWRDRRASPPPRRYSPDYRRRRSYSRSPPRGSSPRRAADYEAPAPAPPADRW